MKCEVEEIDSCNKKLKIEIPLGDYQSQIKAYYQKLGKQVKVPGFRPGKVPVSIMEKRFGPEVKKEVLTQMVSESITQGIEENKLRAVGQPNIVEIQAEEGTDISVTANVEVVPDFTIDDLKNIKVDLQVAKVTEENVDEVIEAYRKTHSKSIPVMDRGAKNDDYLKLNFESTIDGKPFDRSSATDYVVQMGSDNLVEGFDKKIEGMMIDEERTFSLPMPDDHPNQEIAGKTVDFKVTLKGIQIKELPEVDDEFAKIADPSKNYQTVEDMRLGVRKGLEEYERKQARKKSQKQLAENLTNANPIDIPEKLVKEQIAFMVKQEKQKENPSQPEKAPAHKHDHDHDHDHEHEASYSSEDEEKHREAAVKILQQELIIGNLAEEFKVNITEQELDNELNNFMSMLGGGDLKQMKKEWSQSGALMRLHSRMRREKTLDELFDKVQVNEETVDRDQIKSDN